MHADAAHLADELHIARPAKWLAAVVVRQLVARTFLVLPALELFAGLVDLFVPSKDEEALRIVDKDALRLVVLLKAEEVARPVACKK